MAAPSAETSRMTWGVALTWARTYPAWEEHVRRFVAECREAGLTVIDLRQRPYCIDIVATRPGDPHRHEEWI